jgi:hypothetical protein
LLTDRIGERPRFGAVAVAMDQRGRAILLIGGFETPDRALGDAQQLGGFKRGAVAGDEAGKDRQTVLLWGEGNGSIGCHAPEIGVRPSSGPVRRGCPSTHGLREFQISERRATDISSDH